MRKILLLSMFFVISPFVLVFSLLFLLFVTYQNHPNAHLSQYNQKNAIIYAAIPAPQQVLADHILSQEGRTEIIRQFFAKYKSPLESYAGYIVEMADKYDLDFRLIPAIAMQETNLCLKAKEDSHNCWGWGVYGGKYTFFSSYSEAIETISRTLSVKYKNKYGLVTPNEIQRLYNPSNTSDWAYAVNHFMDKLQ